VNEPLKRNELPSAVRDRPFGIGTATDSRVPSTSHDEAAISRDLPDVLYKLSASCAYSQRYAEQKGKCTQEKRRKHPA
jgi:hypothetical protein